MSIQIINVKMLPLLISASNSTNTHSDFKYRTNAPFCRRNMISLSGVRFRDIESDVNIHSTDKLNLFSIIMVTLRNL